MVTAIMDERHENREHCNEVNVTLNSTTDGHLNQRVGKIPEPTKKESETPEQLLENEKAVRAFR